MYSGNFDVDFQNDTVDIAKHDASAKGLKLGGTLVTATAAELNALDGLTATVAELNIMDGVTATAAEINAAADVSSRLVQPGDVAAYTMLAANSGKVHLFPNLTADVTITLPTPASGLEFDFIYGGVTADAQDWIIDTGSDTNYYLGGLLWIDANADAGGDEAGFVAPDGNSNSKMTILNPGVGTQLKLISDGTLWYIQGVISSNNSPTFADQ